MNATEIAGRYRLEGRLGIGGMSTVQLAFDARLERYVAVKLLAEHLADDPTFVSRFKREALSAARLVHPNVVQVFDFGHDEETEQYYIVMEHVEGQSGAQILRDRGKLPVAEALDIVVQSCRGLDYAHRNGVVHRDVKPGNLLRSKDGVAKLADFGIARATDQSSITQVGSVLGTAAYLSPEQAAGEGAGPQSDIYSLAVVTYQFLSGRLPYEANSLSELALRQQREAPAPLDAINPEVPATLARAVAAGLSLDASARPADALAFGEALEAGAAGQEPFGETSATMHLGTSAATQALPSRRRRGGGAPPPPPPPDGTSATQALPSRRAAAVEPLVPRRPERAPAAPVPAPRDIGRPARAQRPAPPSRAKIARRRIAGFLAVLALICAGAAAAIVATSTSKTIVHFRKVVANDVNDAVNTLHDIINKYTK